jgi:formylglycine-generating enzyme required for sulfatase activity
MAGNVWEFVSSDDAAWWECFLRGGSFLNEPRQVQSYFRLRGVPRVHRPPDFGFRCAQELM